MGLKNSISILLFAVSIFVSCTGNAQKTNLSVQEFEKGISQPGAQVLDVRTLEEYQSGHLTGALLADWTNEAEFVSRVKSLEKSRPVYTYCLSGARSDAAVQWLRKNGFVAFNLKGGIAAWKRENKPVKQKIAVKQMTLSEYMAQIPANKTVLVDFGAEWCPPCKKMEPVLDSLVANYGDGFQLVKIDGGSQVSISRELSVEALPTFIIYKNGKPVWRKQGLTELKEFVQQL
ncbi:MAG TPA: thioredoxin domain-containing protein [Chitinophagaceae bacterium]